MKDYWTRASIHDCKGNRISILDVPTTYLMEQVERWGEVVLLSSNAERVSDEWCRAADGAPECDSFKHVKGCNHIQSHNIMLIECYDSIAHRIALGMVQKDDWKGVKTETKTIVLGRLQLLPCTNPRISGTCC